MVSFLHRTIHQKTGSLLQCRKEKLAASNCIVELPVILMLAPEFEDFLSDPLQMVRLGLVRPTAPKLLLAKVVAHHTTHGEVTPKRLAPEVGRRMGLGSRSRSLFYYKRAD